MILLDSSLSFLLKFDISSYILYPPKKENLKVRVEFFTKEKLILFSHMSCKNEKNLGEFGFGLIRFKNIKPYC